MNEKQLIAEARTLGRWERHKFLVLIGITIVISMLLVAIALSLYASSGAAQLDLSRPGYQTVREQATRSEAFSGFSANGPINEESLSQFKSLYATQVEEVNAVDSFRGDLMTDKALSIDDTSKK